MTVKHNIPFELQGTYNNDLRVAFALDIPAGSYIGRDALADAVHIAGTSNNQHPTLAHVIKCRNSHCFSKGTYDIEVTWVEGDYTEAEVVAYINLIMTGAPSYFSNTLDFANHRLTFHYSEQDIEISSWSTFYFNWMLDTPASKIIITSTTDLACFTVLGGNFDKYSYTYRSIEPGATIEIPKSGTDFCFITFTGVVTRGTTDLQAFKTYNQTSSTLTVTNNTSARIRVAKHSR